MLEDKNEKEQPEKVFQCMDGGYRWGIMTSNGSESLNNVFRLSLRLPVAAIVDETFSKCLEWFVEIRRSALNLVDDGKQWSERVDKLLVKRGDRAGHMHVISYGDEVRIFEVKVDHERVPLRHGDHVVFIHKGFEYRVILRPNNAPSCECLKPNLTGVPCAHVLAVCKYRNLNENEIVHSYYSSQVLANTWAGQFHPYGNQNEWPTYNGPTIVPDEKLVNRGHRQHKRIPMYMDEMQGRRMGHQAGRSTRDNNQIGTSSSQGQISLSIQ
ncbi:uncharacterized protein LOC125508848 [Triticum urartu]|uniref:uncharacterized protein LOC125508848 n=1 Tax=Triticum urartu TaxID=4572 RepID=UPI002043053C|nr:uncharacterized protein LOC125508848 [Triticum urartu]